MNRWLTVLMLLLARAAGAQSVPQDFARGIEIRTEGTATIFRVGLPRDVYATVTRADLADLRVFNAAGVPVPMTLRRADLPPPTSAESVKVPLFPMYTAGAETNTAAHVRIDPQGAVLEVTNARRAGASLTAYLIDVSALKTPLANLSLAWQAPAGASFLGRVRVESSDDLNQWRTRVPSTTLAQMKHDAYVLTQSDIDLRGTRARYLRLSWPKELIGVSLTSASVRPLGDRPVPEPTWETLAPIQVSSRPGEATYDAGARLPVERVDLEFADPTDAAHVTVRSRPDLSAEWRTRHAGLFYSLAEANNRITSSPARIGRAEDRYWAVETTRDGGWRPGLAPRLKLGWYPHELLFLAQGDGPFTLAYGSARVRAADAAVEGVLTRLDEESRSRIRNATLAVPHDLGGSAALEAALPWRQVFLWVFLVGAVLALGVFALRLFRTPAAGS